MIRPTHYRCEVDELPPAAAKAFEDYVAFSLSLAWKFTAGPHDRGSAVPVDWDSAKGAEARFVGLLNHQKEWRWGGSTWRLGMYGVERVVG
jgi:hypothetical protein